MVCLDSKVSIRKTAFPDSLFCSNLLIPNSTQLDKLWSLILSIRLSKLVKKSVIAKQSFFDISIKKSNIILCSSSLYLVNNASTSSKNKWSWPSFSKHNFSNIFMKIFLFLEWIIFTVSGNFSQIPIKICQWFKLIARKIEGK